MWRLVNYSIIENVVHLATGTESLTSLCAGGQESGRRHLLPGKRLFQRQLPMGNPALLPAATPAVLLRTLTLSWGCVPICLPQI